MKRLLALLCVVYCVGCGEAKEDTPGLEPCLACSKPVSITAESCVHCGEKEPTKTLRLGRLESRERELNLRAAEIEAYRSAVVSGWGNRPEHTEMDIEFDEIESELAEIVAAKKKLE